MLRTLRPTGDPLRRIMQTTDASDTRVRLHIQTEASEAAPSPDSGDLVERDLHAARPAAVRATAREVTDSCRRLFTLLSHGCVGNEAIIEALAELSAQQRSLSQDGLDHAWFLAQLKAWNRGEAFLAMLFGGIKFFEKNGSVMPIELQAAKRACLACAWERSNKEVIGQLDKLLNAMQSNPHNSSVGCLAAVSPLLHAAGDIPKESFTEEVRTACSDRLKRMNPKLRADMKQALEELLKFPMRGQQLASVILSELDKLERKA
jgi:hypothetical protein